MDSVVSRDRMKGYDDAALRHGQRELFRYDVRDPIFAARFGSFLEENYEKIGLNVYSNELVFRNSCGAAQIRKEEKAGL